MGFYRLVDSALAGDCGVRGVPIGIIMLTCMVVLRTSALMWIVACAFGECESGVVTDRKKQ